MTLTDSPQFGAFQLPTAGHAVSSFVSARPVARTRRIALLGFSATVKDCPWRDDSWELWGMNGFWRAAKPDFGIEADESRYTLWFDLHSRAYTRAYGRRAGFGDEQEKWLQAEHPFPIFMLEEAPDFPSVRAYPVDEVIAQLGRDYFTSSVAYAIAYAATLPDVAELGLWGIDLVHSTEYVDQRPCAEYWLAKAEAAGIKVVTHEQSALLRQRQRYGYGEPTPLLNDLRAALTEQEAGLSKVIEGYKAERARLDAQAHTDDGALQTVRALLTRLDIWERGGRA